MLSILLLPFNCRCQCNELDFLPPPLPLCTCGMPPMLLAMIKALDDIPPSSWLPSFLSPTSPLLQPVQAVLHPCLIHLLLMQVGWVVTPLTYIYHVGDWKSQPIIPIFFRHQLHISYWRINNRKCNPGISMLCHPPPCWAMGASQLTRTAD